MARNLFGGIVVVALAAGAVEPAVGQETATPIFSAPTREFTNNEFGVSASDPGEGADVAIEGFYRFAHGPFDFGLRAGLVDFAGSAGTGEVLLGGDFRTQLVHSSESFPFDGAATLGFGSLFGSNVEDAFFLPVGFSLGRTFDREGSNTKFVPYIHPAVIPVFGAAGGNDVQFAFGLGVDISFSEKWAVRASGSLGDLEGVGISLAYLR